MWLMNLLVLSLLALVGVTTGDGQDNVNVNSDYLGCYRDDKVMYVPKYNNQADRALPFPVKNFFGSQRACVDRCKEYRFKYAGLQNGYLCFCGQNFNKFGRLDDKYCNIKCRGNHLSAANLERTSHGEFWMDCGGEWANSIYSVYGLMEQEHQMAEAQRDDAWIWNNKK